MKKIMFNDKENVRDGIMKIYTEIHVWDRGINYIGNIIFDKKHGIPFLSEEEFVDLILEHFPQLKGKGWIAKFV